MTESSIRYFLARQVKLEMDLRGYGLRQLYVSSEAVNMVGKVLSRDEIGARIAEAELDNNHN